MNPVGSSASSPPFSSSPSPSPPSPSPSRSRARTAATAAISSAWSVNDRGVTPSCREEASDARLLPWVTGGGGSVSMVVDSGVWGVSAAGSGALCCGLWGGVWEGQAYGVVGVGVDASPHIRNSGETLRDSRPSIESHPAPEAGAEEEEEEEDGGVVHCCAAVASCCCRCGCGCGDLSDRCWACCSSC